MTDGENLSGEASSPLRVNDKELYEVHVASTSQGVLDHMERSLACVDKMYDGLYGDKLSFMTLNSAEEYKVIEGWAKHFYPAHLPYGITLDISLFDEEEGVSKHVERVFRIK